MHKTVNLVLKNIYYMIWSLFSYLQCSDTVGWKGIWHVKNGGMMEVGTD